MNKEKLRATFLGTKAVAEGKTMADNPYSEDSELYWVWLEAWTNTKESQ